VAIIKRTLAEATSISEQEEGEIWHKMPESPFRKLVQYYLEEALVRAQEKCAIGDPALILKHQGEAAGLQQAIGILARKDPQKMGRG
jgi:hypothetical protein